MEGAEGKMKFRIFGGGDAGVGVWGTDETVTFEGNLEFDKDMIEQTKKFLAELDDNGASVYTEEEYQELIKLQEPRCCPKHQIRRLGEDGYCMDCGGYPLKQEPKDEEKGK